MVVMSDVITNVDQVTPEWLTDKLQLSGALQHGRVAQIEKSPRRGAAIFPLELTYSSDSVGARPSRLIFKIGRLAEGRFYRDLTPVMAGVACVPHCHGAEYSEATRCSHLLLADVSATHFEPPEMLPMPLPYAQQIVDSLAAIHAYWWEHDRLKTDVGAMAQDAPGWGWHTPANVLPRLSISWEIDCHNDGERFTSVCWLRCRSRFGKSGYLRVTTSRWCTAMRVGGISCTHAMPLPTAFMSSTGKPGTSTLA
jgi:hypothetical protein